MYSLIWPIQSFAAGYSMLFDLSVLIKGFVLNRVWVSNPQRFTCSKKIGRVSPPPPPALYSAPLLPCHTHSFDIIIISTS